MCARCRRARRQTCIDFEAVFNNKSSEDLFNNAKTEAIIDFFRLVHIYPSLVRYTNLFRAALIVESVLQKFLLGKEGTLK